MYVLTTVQCHECNKLRAVYCKQPLRKLEKLHAGRRAVVPDDNGSDSDFNACIHGDADGAAAAGSSGNAPESTQPQAQSSGAPSKHATRRRSQRAAAAAAIASMVQDATDSDSPQSASDSDGTQDIADFDAHADSVLDAIAEMDASAVEEADAGADADTRAALPPGGASKRKRGRPSVAKRARPAGKEGRASAHGPGTYVYGVVQEACDSGLYTCGAVLMPAGHALDPATYCNAALTCAALVESILYNMSASAMSQPLVNFSKGLCSICGIEQVSVEELKEHAYGCSGNHAKKWAACPLCIGCAVQGFKASSVRKTRIHSKRIVQGQKLARAVPAAAHKGAFEASSDYSE
jgi:hypothetical protein